MTSPNGNSFRVTGHLCGEFTGPRWIPAQRPVTRGFDVFFDLGPDKRLSKQSWGWWFETPSHSLWRHRNEYYDCFRLLLAVSTVIHFRKAYHTVEDSIFLDKLYHCGIRGIALQWFKSYLPDRYQYVKYNNTPSDMNRMTCGVPQGSISSPLLFLL